MLLYKNVIKQVMKNRIFVFLLLILTLLTSLSYFFVQFSIDGNMDIIKDKTRLLDNEILWENALKSNTSLANIFLLATTLLTSFVFFMFYYRFFRANKTQLGCIKALGMRDRELLCSFLLFSIVISLLGGVFGIVIGYFLSEVLLQAYIESYSIIKVVKGIHICSLMLGLFVPILAYCTVSCLSFWVMIKGREPGALIAGRVPYKKLGMSFHIADILANANTASIYCNADELSKLIGFNRGSYNGLWSKERIAGSSFSKSREQRIERLERDAVSNKLSAVINQITGAVVGMILLFLAMFLNFQDNQRDMDILRMIGYQNKEIRRLFIDIYWPITVAFFILTIIPGIAIAQTIQRGLSLSIGDYMPFGVNWKIVVFMFLVMNILYGCVWCIFKLKLKK